jgi:hypothetical protein
MNVSDDLLGELISTGVAEALRNHDRSARWRTGTVVGIDAVSRLAIDVLIDGDPITSPIRMRSVAAVGVNQRVLVVFTEGGGVWCLGALGGPMPAIADADGTLADLTAKFNRLLNQMRTAGFLAP